MSRFMIIFKNEIFNVSTFLALAYNVEAVGVRFFALSECSILARISMAAFAKPLLPAGRFISRNLNLKRNAHLSIKNSKRVLQLN